MKTKICCLFCLLCCLASCISTRNIADDDQLFVGLSKISYDKDSIQHSPLATAHETETKAEVEMALATAPNGAFFGSSYYRSPFSWRLWVYNKYSGKESKFAKWMVKSFGKPPVLMSQVNPALRASVAQSVLKNNGYFRGNVTYEAVPQKNPKKGKIAYHVHLDSLFTYDSIAYVGFPDKPRQLLDSTATETVIRKGAPFSVSDMESERNRINTLLRNNGYYYYTLSYTTYLADTIAVPNRTQLRIQLADGLPDETMQQWYIGNIAIHFRHTMREELNDSIHRRHLSLFFNGKRPPIRPGVVLKNMRLFPRQLYSYEKYQETAAKVNATGVFSAVDFQFTPRAADTLDLRLNCTFDKPYDFYIETNVNARTIGRYGPEMKVGFTKRNAFRGAELMDINLHGNYEWQSSSNGNSMNSYQYGIDASIEFPRLLVPFYNSDRVRRNSNRNGRPRRRRFFSTPTTLAKASVDIIQHPGYYKMNVVSGEWTYRWQPSAQKRHEFSPLTLKYQHMSHTTDDFFDLMASNLYIATAMSDQFIPKMRYTYTYTSPTTQRNPIRWETTIAEAGNFTALYDVAIQGNKWNQKEKTLFKNPYAQFVRVETDFTKTWQLTANSQLVGHLNGGIIYSYGNIDDAPFSEMFYIGGANSIRAFTVRGIGPGGSIDLIDNKQFSYLMRNGDIKLLGNLEFRTRLSGNLHGALFLDAGNIWKLPFDIEVPDDNYTDAQLDFYNQYTENDRRSQFRLSRLLDQTAVGTGFGLRYDLGFLVIRLDWGVALHLPYDTGRSGYFNWGKFKDIQALHFAIGYPF